MAATLEFGRNSKYKDCGVASPQTLLPNVMEHLHKQEDKLGYLNFSSHLRSGNQTTSMAALIKTSMS